LGIDRPRSRRHVAELTDLQPAQVKRLERSGLRHLRVLHEGGCGAPAADGGDTSVSAVLGATSGSGPGANAVLGESERSAGQAPASEGGSEGSRTPLAKVADGGSKAVPDFALLLIPIVVLGFLMFAAKELRRTLNRV
jgi:hypothetical protein